MPPLRPLPAEITSLTDEELIQQLLQYNFRPGPILPSTRSVYEKKLFKLQTGQEAASPSRYEPVDDDDEDGDEDSVDEDVVLQQQQPRQRMTRSTRTEVKTPPRQSAIPRQTEKPSGANKSHNRPQSAHSQKETSTTSTGGLPLWVKLLAVLMVAGLVFLVIKNMEADPAGDLPEMPEQLEINV